MSLSDYIDDVLPGWMRRSSRRHWVALCNTVAHVIDAMIDGLYEGRLAAFPGQIAAPQFGGFENIDALPFIGRDRRLVRGPTETEVEYAARLRGWREAWRAAGTGMGLLGAIRAVMVPTPPLLRVVSAAGVWWSLEEDGTYRMQTGDGLGIEFAPDGTIAPDTTNAHPWDWDGGYATVDDIEISGGQTVTFSGHPSGTYSIVIECTDAGTIGTAPGPSVRYSADGGTTYTNHGPLGTNTTLALIGTGLTATFTATQVFNGGDTITASTSVDTSRIWPIIYAPSHPPYLADIDGQWGDGLSVYRATPEGTIGTTAPKNYVEMIRGIVADWKPGGLLCPNIIVAFDPESFDPATPGPYPAEGMPDGFWKYHGKAVDVGGGDVVWQRARLATARYWRGTPA